MLNKQWQSTEGNEINQLGLLIKEKHDCAFKSFNPIIYSDRNLNKAREKNLQLGLCAGDCWPFTCDGGMNVSLFTGLSVAAASPPTDHNASHFIIICFTIYCKQF